jgi:NAD(P)-dependent dehydrogenase (short-subunit alcohol dehydrogenase family)
MTVAVITGATRGIGLGLFKHLASKGVHIATIYHSDTDAANNFVEEANNYGISYLIE